MLDSRLSGSGFEPHRGHCIVSFSKNINPSLVLVQARKTRPFITERLLMGRKESNQTKTKQFSNFFFKNAFRVSNSLDPDLGPNCLQRLLADNTSTQRVEAINIYYCRCCAVYHSLLSGYRVFYYRKKYFVLIHHEILSESSKYQR